MREISERYARSHPLRAALVALVVLGLLVFSASEIVRWVEWYSFSLRTHALASAEPSGDVAFVPLRFDAFGVRNAVFVPIDDAEFGALSRIPAEDAFKYRGRWRERFMTTYVDALARSRFIGCFADQLGAIRDRKRLDDDEYLELMVTAVQSIRYARADGDIRTPIEVVAAREGICTERSVLLAALMVHEDYNTVMWSFRKQSHVALGVAADGPTFRDTGYAFIETTHLAYIGEVDAEYLGAGPVYEPPEVIVLGGAKRYGASLQSAYILNVLAHAEEEQARASLSVFDRVVAAGRGSSVEVASDIRAAELADFIRQNRGDRPRVYQTLRDRPLFQRPRWGL